jgi:hypothetical protein
VTVEVQRLIEIIDPDHRMKKLHAILRKPQFMVEHNTSVLCINYPSDISDIKPKKGQAAPRNPLSWPGAGYAI